MQFSPERSAKYVVTAISGLAGVAWVAYANQEVNHLFTTPLPYVKCAGSAVHGFLFSSAFVNSARRCSSDAHAQLTVSAMIIATASVEAVLYSYFGSERPLTTISGPTICALISSAASTYYVRRQQHIAIRLCNGANGLYKSIKRRTNKKETTLEGVIE